MAQLAAEGLGVKIEDVRVNTVDTDYSPYEWQTVASRLTWSMGNAVLQAAENARYQILKTVAEAWNEDINDLDIIDGEVISYRTEESRPLRDLVIYGLQRPDGTWIGGPVVGQGKFMPEYVTPLDAETGQGPRAVVHFTTGCQAVEVEVDDETGEVQVLKIVSAYDVGRAINPDMVRTQMEGGAVQGMSTALLEGIILHNGVPKNPNFTDYRIATAVDAPLELESIIVEVPQDDGPFGARGRRAPDGSHRAGHRQRDLPCGRRAAGQYADLEREGVGGIAGGWDALTLTAGGVPAREREDAPRSDGEKAGGGGARWPCACVAQTLAFRKPKTLVKRVQSKYN